MDKKKYLKEWRRRNKEHIREYNRKRNLDNKHKKLVSKITCAYAKRNPEKHRAKRIVAYHKLRGDICEHCGNKEDFLQKPL